MQPGNPAFGGTVLRIPAEQSPNYVAGTSGWYIGQDGSAEFNQLDIRGTFFGADFVINSLGAFFYSGTPTTGNLIASITPASGANDGEGNAFQAGITSYTAGGEWLAMAAGMLTFDGGCVIAEGPSGGLKLEIATGGQLVVTVNGSTVILVSGGAIDLDQPVVATAGTAASPTLITTDSWHAVSMAAGWSTLAGYPVPSYKLLPSGRVAVSGLATHAAFSANTALSNSALPAAYRPLTNQFIAPAEPGAAGLLIDTSGNLTATTGASTGTAAFTGTYPVDL